MGLNFKHKISPNEMAIIVKKIAKMSLDNIPNLHADVEALLDQRGFKSPLFIEELNWYAEDPATFATFGLSTKEQDALSDKFQYLKKGEFGKQASTYASIENVQSIGETDTDIEEVTMAANAAPFPFPIGVPLTRPKNKQTEDVDIEDLFKE